MVNNLRLEHIGIAVKDAKTSLALFTALLGYGPYKSEKVETEKVETHFFKLGDTKIELLEASDESSTLSRFINKKGEGIHHIAFLVENIKAEIERLKAAGFEFVHDEPKRGADNKLICFIHPKSSNGVLIELCEEIQISMA